jgi:hypothetical protein
MTSYRTQVNTAFKAALNGRTVAGPRVHTALDRALSPSDLPAILIYTQAAKRGPQDYGNSLIPRMLTVTIEAALEATPEAAMVQAEALVESIEAAIEADPTLGNVVQDCRWQQSVADVSSMGKVTLGVGLLAYDVTILTHERPPEAFGIGDDGFDQPPATVFTAPDAHAANPFPALHPEFECGPDGCNVPAWGGETTP